jgi:GDP-4-dehydro-6-deoxy-D-mannose reductase
MSKVLVTGAGGFLGRHLVPQLRAAGHDVTEARGDSGDVADPVTWRRFPVTDAVIHLAARSFVPESWNLPADFMRTNLLGTIGALDYCRERGAGLIFPSSYMYGHVARQPIGEDACLVANNPYALSKKLAEEACRFYADAYGVTVTVLRPFNIYGAGQSDRFLIPTILHQLRDGKEIHVKDLEPRRDYVYVLDVVDAMVKAVGCRPGFNVFNVGSGASHSVRELIHMIQDVWGTDLPVRSDGERRREELMDTVADTTRARQQLGWTPRFSLRHGLEDLRSAQ